MKDRKTKEPFEAKLKVAHKIQDVCLDENMIIEASSGCNRGQSGDALVISPAFVITKEEVDKIADRLDKAISKVEKELNI